MAFTCLCRRPALLPLNGVAHIIGHFVKTEERILLVHCFERKTEFHFIFVACAEQHAPLVGTPAGSRTQPKITKNSLRRACAEAEACAGVCANWGPGALGACAEACAGGGVCAGKDKS